jgi:hypothetical protein
MLHMKMLTGLLTFSLALTLQAAAQTPQATVVNDPIAFIGHGALYDKAGNEINVTPEFIKKAQNYYLDQLYKQATASQRSAIDEKKTRVFQGVQLDAQSELVANSKLIDSLIKDVNPPNSGELLGKNNILDHYLHSRMPAFNQAFALNALEKFVLPTDLAEKLKVEGLAPAAPTLSTAALKYIKECSDAGVPIPPDFGDPKWINKGTFTTPFISEELPFVEVLTYASTSPEGACLALPRAKTSTDDIALAGIICLGKVSGKACFWDNQRDKKQLPIPRGTKRKLTDFAGGPELEGGSGGICTSCHAGENPFIIHPKTSLGAPNLTGLKLKPDVWYQPLVAAAWPQNPGPSNILDGVDSPGDCTDCHTQKSAGRFPKLSTALDGYCTKILPNAVKKTMPPGSPDDPDYAPDVAVLLAACQSPP